MHWLLRHHHLNLVGGKGLRKNDCYSFHIQVSNSLLCPSYCMNQYFLSVCTYIVFCLISVKHAAHSSCLVVIGQVM